MSRSGLAYLDASAFVKLVAAEPESQALRAELIAWPQAIASELLEVEAQRFAQRYGGTAPRLVSSALRRITLVPMGSEIRRLAVAAKPPELRTLDAIHLATALVLGSTVGAFFAYDKTLASAAKAAGLAVLAPG